MAGKSMLCRLGMHSWQDKRTDDGEPYIECRRCGQENDKITLSDHPDIGGGPLG